MKNLITAITLLLFPPSLMPVPAKGNLVIIGGALKDDNRAVYRHLIELGGGKKRARIAVISAASGSPVDSGEKIREVFRQYGIPAKSIRVFPLAVIDDPGTEEDESLWRMNSEDESVAADLMNYNLIFFSGGDQARLGDLFIDQNGKDTPALESIRKVYVSGGTIAGTSAGAAVMCDPMITSGTSIASLTGAPPADAPADVNSDHLTLKRGFGLIRTFLIDQHFIKRGRIGRLITALVKIKEKTARGIGIDEDTALCVKGDEAQVIGRSGVIFCDISQADIRMTERGLAARGIRIDYLHSGDRVNLKTGEFTIHRSRKEINPGEEYYRTKRSSTDIFAKDAFRELLTAGIADNRQTEASGIAFLTGEEVNRGTRLTLLKSETTRSYLGKINGEYTYSVIHAELALQPITVIIREGTSCISVKPARSQGFGEDWF